MTLVLAVILAMPVALAPHAASAGIFDFLFGGDKPQRQEPQQQQPSNAFADPFGLSNPNPAPAPAAATGGRFTTFCVRACDGRYFPLTMRGNGTPAQMCQAFCPASATKVYSGNSIDYAVIEPFCLRPPIGIFFWVPDIFAAKAKPKSWKPHGFIGHCASQNNQIRPT